MKKFEISVFQVPHGETDALSGKVELRGPRGDEDVRVHATWRASSVAMLRHQSKFFVLDPALRPALAGHWFVAELRAACSSDGQFFIWPVRDADETTKQAADAAVGKWTRLTWVTRDKDYLIEAGKEHDEPAWSSVEFDDLLEAALNGRILSGADEALVEAIRKKKVLVKSKAKEKKEEKKAKAK